LIPDNLHPLQTLHHLQFKTSGLNKGADLSKCEEVGKKEKGEIKENFILKIKELFQ
jgi:hypothetical protein